MYKQFNFSKILIRKKWSTQSFLHSDMATRQCSRSNWFSIHFKFYWILFPWEQCDGQLSRVMAVRQQ